MVAADGNVYYREYTFRQIEQFYYSIARELRKNHPEMSDGDLALNAIKYAGFLSLTEAEIEHDNAKY